MATIAATVTTKMTIAIRRLRSRKSRKAEDDGASGPLPRAPIPPTSSFSWLRTDMLRVLPELTDYRAPVPRVGLDHALHERRAHDVRAREGVEDDPGHVLEDVAGLE